ncbi:hypothetical protein KX729_07610 [Rhizobium sp. XQZ8]|uniref:hypothetical protein n=1 Tax=Rhizobium populisoli TaxID=2859785 RepID=UPI001CA5B7C4|nr:hypothetical protein [Rhizobium populisoli]MBW6421304.1 hypothetical protein [Rhizobium populisoli]
MKIVRIAASVVGVLITLIGLVWMGQGTGFFPYPATSFMINQTPWIINGVIAVVVGLAVLVFARRFSR